MFVLAFVCQAAARLELVTGTSRIGFCCGMGVRKGDRQCVEGRKGEDWRGRLGKRGERIIDGGIDTWIWQRAAVNGVTSMHSNMKVLECLEVMQSLVNLTTGLDTYVPSVQVLVWESEFSQ